MTEVRIGEIADVVSGGTPKRSRIDFWGGGIPWVKTSEIDYSTIDSTEETITELGLEQSSARIVPPGTILMAMYGQGKTRAQVAILGISAAINQACAAIQLLPGVDRDFVYYQLSHLYGRIRQLSNSGNQDNLSAELIRSIKVTLLPLPEQRRVGEILAASDAEIEQIGTLMCEKERQRSALARRLLFGRHRLHEFADEWRQVALGDVLAEVSRPVEWDDAHVYRLVSVRRRSGGLFYREPQVGSDIQTKTMYTTRTGDFVIARMQVIHGAMAMTTPEFDGGHVSGSYITLIPRKGSALHMPFLDQLSRTRWFYHLTYLSSYGVAIEKMTFSLRDFLKRQIRLPANLDEQEAIVGALRLCELEIAALGRKQSALQRQKKALMQKLLTGQIRVEV